MASKKRKLVKKADTDLNKLRDEIVNGNRTSLAKAITLVESNAERHFQQSQEVLQKVMPHTGNSIRIGISGVPGAGKSTFIEAFGLFLVEQGKKVAVLAVDPSSTKSGGSILGDKTRMEQLARHPRAFIRPSPSSGSLGGVHRKTRESILLCEAAGFDVILVETVGVGQSEGLVRDMVDFFLLLVLTGAGDELQGMKKGIMELVDTIVVNKADGENVKKAKKTAEEYNQILHFLQPATPSWTPSALTCSSLYYEGMSDVWSQIQTFQQEMKQSGFFEQRRNEQKEKWLDASLKMHIERLFFQQAIVKNNLPLYREKIKKDELSVSKAVQELIELYQKT
ncbi:methylmalonyl Co-A mutase-associated GTPase MeaB [Bacillus sp. FJAT-45066]|uniref:methylmalonyl Co-A mutase-associated GTPase MeaB n=1 Tax=Bacillus sp. FJAT-45066 TaxID=2011010 RepID=UPI000BB94E65|nr:methylmalonyl Co-A mutase-associated GTPase MeaB [Bacillus sp. FJAT-45066]